MRPGTWPLAAALLALAAWACCLTLPWLIVPGEGAGMTRQDLLASEVRYERALAAWPLAALPVVAAGLGAAAWGRHRAAGVTWLPVCATIIGGAALLALVAGARIIGFVAVLRMEPGSAGLWPGPAPLAAAAAGAMGLAWSVLTLRSLPTPVPASSAAAALALLLMPFVPFGRSASGEVLYDELSLAGAAASGGLLQPAAQALAWLRGALWLAIAGGAAVLLWSAASAGAADAAHRGPAPAWRLALLAPGPLAAVVLCVVFLVRWDALPGTGLAWNPFAALGAAASVAALAPLARSLFTPSAATDPSVFKDDLQ